MSTQIERFTVIADKIREKTETTDKIIPNDFVNKIDDVYNKGVSDGKQSQYDLFWDNFQDKGNLKCYPCAFQKWDASAFYPKYDIIVAANNGNQYGGASSMFHLFNSEKDANQKETKEPIDLAQRLEECGVILDTSRVNSFAYSFQMANVTRLPTIDTRGATSIGYMLFYHSVVETIDKLILKDDGSQTSNSNNFEGCTKLKNIIIEGVIGKNINFQWSTLLTKESITSIINALSDTTGATLTLSKTAVNNAFETAEGLSDGSSSQEWIDLITSKSNTYNGLWTITLV